MHKLMPVARCGQFAGGDGNPNGGAAAL